MCMQVRISNRLVDASTLRWCRLNSETGMRGGGGGVVVSLYRMLGQLTIEHDLQWNQLNNTAILVGIGIKESANWFHGETSLIA